MTNTLNRSPFQNDLITEPGQTAILHESSQLMPNTTFNNEQIGFSFDWMLSVPFLTTKIRTLNDIEDVKVLYQGDAFSPHKENPNKLDFSVYTENSIACAWANIPLAWSTYIRPQLTNTISAVKTFAPSKVSVEYNHSYSTVNDVYKKRNYTYEVDLTMQKNHTFRAPVLLTRPLIPSSVLIDGYSPPVFNGCSIAISQLMNPQRGSLFPATFDILLWGCLAGSTLHVINTPQMNYNPAYNTDDATIKIRQRAILGAINSTNNYFAYKKIDLTPPEDNNDN